MRQLILSLGFKICTVSPTELRAYPDSLLARLAAGEPDENVGTGKQQGASDNSCLTIKLDEPGLPTNPLSNWPEALDILPWLYRQQPLPASLLEQLLRDKPPQTSSQTAVATAALSPASTDMPQACTSEASRQPPHQSYSSGGSLSGREKGSLCHDLRSFYDSLNSLLNYLGIPGPVSRLLPFNDVMSQGLKFSAWDEPDCKKYGWAVLKKQPGDVSMWFIKILRIVEQEGYTNSGEKRTLVMCTLHESKPPSGAPAGPRLDSNGLVVFNEAPSTVANMVEHCVPAGNIAPVRITVVPHMKARGLMVALKRMPLEEFLWATEFFLPA